MASTTSLASLYCGLLLLAVCPAIADAQERITGAGTMAMDTAASGTDVLTRSYDIGRTGANVRESALTPDSISHGLKKLFSLDVTSDPAHHDDPRLEAQPLIVTRLRMNDGQVHDVAYVCTMDNNVWAFDANTGAKIWNGPVSLGPPIKPPLTPAAGFPTRTAIDLWGINIHWGILSTPVIDRDTQTMYVVNWTSDDGSVNHAIHKLHALDLVSGKEQPNSPATIEASFKVPGKPDAKFISPRQKQRSALLLLPGPNAHLRAVGSPTVLSGAMGDDAVSPQAAQSPGKTLIMACGQFGENAIGQHGWLLAFDPGTLKQTAAFCTTPASGGGGIWQAGQGPAADAGSNIYLMTANGGFNGMTDFAESFLMLHYTAPVTNGANGKLELKSWFTPFRDADRLASEPRTGYSFQDQDLGSAGPVVPSGTGLVMGAGKDGVLYVLGKGKFGNTSDADIDSHSQFASLKSSPVFFTYFPGFQVDPTSIADLDHNFQGKTHHLHHSPVYWNSPDMGPLLFGWGENESLRAWAVDATGKVAFQAIGHEIASEGAPGMGGMPGGMITLSANGRTKHTGIVWASVPIHGDGNRHIVEGILRAYDASEFVVNPDNSKSIKLLWDSKQIVGNTFNYNKFCPPVVANGKVYCTTYDGRVDVYGL